MQFYVAVFVVLAVSLVQEGESSKCNYAVLDRLAKLCLKKGIPSGFVEKSVSSSPDLLLASTDGYFAEQDDISCISTSWNTAGFVSTFSFKNKEPVSGPRTHVQEVHGQSYQPEGKIRRYHIPTSGLVNAFYKCEEEGAEGSAHGAVKVWKGYATQDVDTAITDLEEVLGNKLSKRFADNC